MDGPCRPLHLLVKQPLQIDQGLERHYWLLLQDHPGAALMIEHPFGKHPGLFFLMTWKLTTDARSVLVPSHTMNQHVLTEERMPRIADFDDSSACRSMSWFSSARATWE
jgi:hypothetical protein